MSDLIDRQAAIDAICEHGTDLERRGITVLAVANHKQVTVDLLEKLPSAEKHGRWEVTDAYPHNVYCSECHKRFAQTHWTVWEDGSLPRNYCPNCGASMLDRDINVLNKNCGAKMEAERRADERHDIQG